MASEEAGAWDEGAVGQPCAVAMAEGRWRLYYTGRSAGPGSSRPWEGIGLALSDATAPMFEGIPSKFKRRTGTT